MTTYDNTYKLDTNEGSSQKASNQYIVIHDTANDNNQGDNSAQNEASYMHGHWQDAYTHAIAGWDRVYLVGEPGYVAYGAGEVANSRSPFQIELSHYSDPAKQRASYINYINAIREMANKFGIPLTLDGAGNGIKSHKWVSDNIWGDHQDPYAYLARIGISKDQLAHDLANGIGNNQSAPTQTNSNNKGEITMYLINCKDTKRWYLSTGTEIKYIKTTRVLNFYQNGLKLPVDVMYQEELDNEFGKGATDPKRDVSKG